jgi:hypothetical protein
MWTDENRAKYNRDKLRYPSDVTDEEWAHVEPLISPAKRGGRKRQAVGSLPCRARRPAGHPLRWHREPNFRKGWRLCEKRL